jgi:CBS-domain-containing membrane protein
VLLAIMTSERGEAARARSGSAADVMERPALAVGPRTTIHALVNDVLPDHRQTSFLVTDEGKLHGVVHLESIRDVPREAWQRTALGAYVTPVDDSMFVAAGDPSTLAAHKAETNGFGFVAVLDGDGMVAGTIGRSPQSRLR